MEKDEGSAHGKCLPIYVPLQGESHYNKYATMECANKCCSDSANEGRITHY